MRLRNLLRRVATLTGNRAKPVIIATTCVLVSGAIIGDGARVRAHVELAARVSAAGGATAADRQRTVTRPVTRPAFGRLQQRRA